jgi:hypothetical protein
MSLVWCIPQQLGTWVRLPGQSVESFYTTSFLIRMDVNKSIDGESANSNKESIFKEYKKEIQLYFPLKF